jgi:iron complex outermembrane recepter protein
MWMWDSFDASKVEASFRGNNDQWTPSGTTVSTLPVPRIISEAVSAFYAQGDVKIGSLNILGGARVEHTAVRGRSQNTDPKNPTVTAVTVNRSYDKIFPSVHFRYSAARNLLLRASYSTGSARPSISNMLPTTTISYLTDGTGLGTVRQNNPGIKPNYANTYDLSAEYYFEPAGVLSVGLFHKDIKDFINTEIRLIGAGADNGFGGQYENFTFTTSNNLGSAKIRGLEANYSQQFRNLPKPFNGLSVSANYTRLNTEGQYANGARALANFTPWTANLGASYTWRKLQVRYMYRFKSTYLTSYSATALSSTYVNQDNEIDINVEYKWKPSLAIFFDISNLNDTGFDQFSLNMSRVNSAADPGRRMNAGISGRF